MGVHDDVMSTGTSTGGGRNPPRSPLRLILLPKAVQLWSYGGGDLTPCTEWEFLALRGGAGVATDSQTDEKQEDKEHVVPLRASDGCGDDGCDRALPIKRLRVGKTYPRRTSPDGAEALVAEVLPGQAIPMAELSRRRSVPVPGALLRKRKEADSCLKLPDPTGCVPVPWILEMPTTRFDDGSRGNLPTTTVRRSHPVPGDLVVAPWSREIDGHGLYTEGPDVEPPRQDLPRMNRALVEKGRWFSGTVIRHSHRYDALEVPTVQVEFEDGNRKWIPRALAVPIPRDGPMELRPWSRKLHERWPSEMTREAVRTALLCQVRLRNEGDGLGDAVTTLAAIGELLVDEVLPFAMPPHWPKILSAFEPSRI